ncbi:hypothetical protein ASG40_09080 [Methylobacterium sp. Leaf399]|uniref:hypothetical protein n=1 Tax=unclassified Methylobacterium TaxID=2615210 RepID=UPI0006F78317|nr:MULTISPECIES: hypothetical protein [unclassified Methylobacterium]KQP55142.1 hypothetical protein ASF39_05320 [Methylobacterium sp. Leaf108]KQT09881.1 hypothetical protein ASG40_09080 [Methylobacterium sp. Leaf399]KQT77883.1 hypothetical protein ASG59_11225 [Methylobacterium sp. Leaf466]
MGRHADSTALPGRILALLPQDGTPVLNRVMRALIARDGERPVPAETYFSACDDLVGMGRIGRLRGQGGQIFLVAASATETAEPSSESVEDGWAEARLMAPLQLYLEGAFRKGLDLGDGLCLVQDTSGIGPRRGQWARPDFLLVSALRFRLLPGAQIDVHAFELKTEAGGTVQAVHEALAQTRFTHFGHLVWHLPTGARSEGRLPEIASQCATHGIGLIRLRDPREPDLAEILLDPVRKATVPAIVDGFLESRLTRENRARLVRVLAETVS